MSSRWHLPRSRESNGFILGVNTPSLKALDVDIYTSWASWKSWVEWRFFFWGGAYIQPLNKVFSRWCCLWRPRLFESRTPLFGVYIYIHHLWRCWQCRLCESNVFAWGLYIYTPPLKVLTTSEGLDRLWKVLASSTMWVERLCLGFLYIQHLWRSWPPLKGLDRYLSK